jgi:hypothetical protein
LGSDSSTPVLFPIEKNGESQKKRDDKSSGSTNSLISPEILLSQILKDRSGTEVGSIVSESAEMKKPASSIVKPSTSSVAEPAPAATKVKKGFLNDPQNAGALYPTGSSEGSMGSAGGTLARVMDKCKVINMNSSSGTVETTSKAVVVEDSVKVPTVTETRKMELLACELDEDWNVGKAAMTIDDEDFFSSNLMKLANSSCPTLVPPPGTPIDEMMDKRFVQRNIVCGIRDIAISSNAPPDDEIHITLKEEVFEGNLVAVLRVSGLKETDTLDNINLNVAQQEIVLDLKGGEVNYRFSGFKTAFIPDRTLASFSQKKRTLKITAFFSF